MEQYILELIRNNNRVIIPNFGAFIVAKEKGFTILFNNFLSFNDGLLVEHVMTKEDVDKLEATDRINKFVERINKTLDTTGNYKLDGLGVFTKDSTGILRFTQDEELNKMFFDSTEEEDKENDELLDIESTTPEDETKEQHDEPTVVVPPPVNEVIETPSIEPEQATKKPRVHKDPQKEEKEKERIALFVVLFVLIPIIGFGIYYFFFTGNDEIMPVKAKQEVVKQKPIVKPENTGIVAGPESTVEKKSVKAETITPAVKKTTIVSRRHYIITGSFKDERNANKYVDMMRSKGFSSPVAIPHNGMHLIGVESFSSLTKAMARQEEMLTQYKLESWILTIK